MLKEDVIKRLDELQGLDRIEIVIHQTTSKIVHVKSLHNHINSEMLLSVLDNFEAPYEAISEIRPVF